MQIFTQEQGFEAALHTYRCGDHVRTKEQLEKLLLQFPGLAEGFNLLGVCELNLGELEAAKRSFRQAVTLAGRATFFSNLGMVLARSGDLEGAAEAYQSAIELEPNAADICANYANVLSEQRQFDRAIELYRKAIELAPGDHGICKNMLIALTQADRHDEALPIYRQLGEFNRLQFEMRNRAEWDDLASVDAECLRQIDEGTLQVDNPWPLLFVQGITAEREMKAAQSFARAHISIDDERPLCSYRKVAIGSRPLRIGYLSSDFYSHATLLLLIGVLESHDRQKCDVRLFSIGPRSDDDYSRRLQAAELPLIDLAHLSDSDAAKAIFEQQIDLLVDLTGHLKTKITRINLTAQRPAPIIVNWLGYPGTMGDARLADYIIGDPVVTPESHAEFYSERLALMPHCYQPNDHTRVFPEMPRRADVGLPDKAIVFSCFNQVLKFNPQTFDIWSRLLAAVPNSVLWLLRPKSPVAVENLKQEMKARGISEDNIVFAEFAPQKEHLARLRLANIALDTFPCNSHTTASDALWAGVPIITRRGETFASRVAASLLTAHGFPDLVAGNPEEYFQLALELAKNGKKRGKLKTRLERARTTSPLFDTARFTRNLERLYTAIAENHNQPEETRPRVVMLG